MPICSICEGQASDLLCGRWYCRQCMQAVLDKPSPFPPPPREKVSILDETGHLIRAPFCSICHDRIAAFIVFGTAICMDCSRAKREWPDEPDELEDSQVIPDKPQRSHKGSSVIGFPDEYVCIDVETTGIDFIDDEIIEVAALHVKDGAICDRFSSLIRPLRSHIVFSYGTIHKLGYDSFDDVPREVFDDYCKRNLVSDSVEQLTGITNDMLLNGPTEDVVIPQFHEFIGNHILVGHNVNFDINFLYDACQRCGLVLGNGCVDTLRIARKLLPELKHHRLSDVASYFGIRPDTVHRAEADVITTIECFNAMKSRILETQTISDFVKEAIGSSPKISARSMQKIKKKHFRTSELVLPDTVDPSHPLYGKSVVFTGELSVSRREAAQMATDRGASVKTKVSRKTDFLVVGQQDIAVVDISGISGSERAAQEINASGKGNIQIITEQDFINLVNPGVEAGAL